MNNLNKTQCLKIADYCILLESNLDYALTFDPIYNNFFFNADVAFDVKITVQCGIPNFDFHTASKLTADIHQYIKSETVQRNWHIYKKEQEYYVYIFSTHNPATIDSILHISKDKNWQLYVNKSLLKNDLTSIFAHPLISLIVYYCSVFHHDIFIHGSGIADGTSGRLYSGFSGAGKTTMARIWKQNGATVIHDDRLVLRKNMGQWMMHNTPVYLTDYPKCAPVHEVYFLSHYQKNKLEKLQGTNAVAKILSCCIQHDFDKKIVTQLIESIADFCAHTTQFNLGFYPDEKIIPFIQNR